VAAEPAFLVVDDNEDNRYTLIQRLKRLGYANVTTAAHGREALERLRERPFDLVLLDVMMPELNGYQVLEQLKVDAQLRHLPVIMISALDELDSVIRCIELGAEDYLSKPFNPTLLKARVGASLEKKRLRDELVAHLARIEHELDSAREIQLGMVPGRFPAPTPETPVEIFAALQPARQIGGDLYDFFYLDAHTLCLVIADVSDKGAPAALFMAHTKTLIRVVATLLRTADGRRPGPAEVIAMVNAELCADNKSGMFVTAFFAILDIRAGVLSFCNAGHNTPYLIKGRGDVAALDGVHGRALGVRSASVYTNGSSTLSPGDCLFLFTDGITEAVDNVGRFFEDERLQSSLKAMAGGHAENIVEAVVGSVHVFAGATPQADDIAAMAIRLMPAVDAADARPAEHIEIDNKVDELARVAAFVDELAARERLPGDAVADIQIALDEVLNNIVNYAFADGKAHTIRLEFRVYNEVLEAQIEDDGPPFDPIPAAAANNTAKLSERQAGGLGIHFVKHLMSEVAYARAGNRNRLLLRKRFVREEGEHVGAA
jgi:phosphoserine phosphatase RsbU/P